MTPLSETSDSCDSGHLTVVVVSRRLRDGFRRRYWVRCWDCDLRRGPFVTRIEAHNCERHAWEGFR